MEKNETLILALLRSRFASQFDLAKKVNINYSILNGIFNGRVNPKEKEKMLLSQALNVPKEKLFPNN